MYSKKHLAEDQCIKQFMFPPPGRSQLITIGMCCIHRARLLGKKIYSHTKDWSKMAEGNPKANFLKISRVEFNNLSSKGQRHQNVKRFLRVKIKTTRRGYRDELENQIETSSHDKRSKSVEAYLGEVTKP